MNRIQTLRSALILHKTGYFSLYRAARDKLVVNKNMRQGEIIINFMKSDKHLFI